MIDELVQRRHQALVEQRVDHFPIGRIPSDQQNFLARGSGMENTGASLAGDSLLERQFTTFPAAWLLLARFHGQGTRTTLFRKPFDSR